MRSDPVCVGSRAAELTCALLFSFLAICDPAGWQTGRQASLHAQEDHRRRRGHQECTPGYVVSVQSSHPALASMLFPLSRFSRCLRVCRLRVVLHCTAALAIDSRHWSRYNASLRCVIGILCMNHHSTDYWMLCLPLFFFLLCFLCLTVTSSLLAGRQVQSPEGNREETFWGAAYSAPCQERMKLATPSCRVPYHLCVPFKTLRLSLLPERAPLRI